MRSLRRAIIIAILTVRALSMSTSDACTKSYAQSKLPSNNVFPGITIETSSLIATLVTNASIAGNSDYPSANLEYCNVTFAYSHNGRNDRVVLTYWLPAPSNFQNRYLSTGGSGYAITVGNSSLPGGIIYGAVAGTTDGGFGGFNSAADDVWLLSNNTLNYKTLFMFGYEAIHELTVIGKQFTKQFFNTSSLFSYYQGCSEGGGGVMDSAKFNGGEMNSTALL